MHKTIIITTGKAGKAFWLFDLFCQEYGNLTLGEISKDMSRQGCWVMWRANPGMEGG